MLPIEIILSIVIENGKQVTIVVMPIHTGKNVNASVVRKSQFLVELNAEFSLFNIKFSFWFHIFNTYF